MSAFSGQRGQLQRNEGLPVNRFFSLLLRLKIFLIKISLSLVLVSIHGIAVCLSLNFFFQNFIHSNHTCVPVQILRENPPPSEDICHPLRPFKKPEILATVVMELPVGLVVISVIQPALEWSFPQMCYFKINRICDILIPVLGTFQWWLTGRWLVWFLKRKEVLGLNR